MRTRKKNQVWQQKPRRRDIENGGHQKLGLPNFKNPEFHSTEIKKNKQTYFSTNLVSALTGLDVYDFPHCE